MPNAGFTLNLGSGKDYRDDCLNADIRPDVGADWVVDISDLHIGGIVKWKDTDGLFTEGMKMMAMIGFIMIAASGFADVMKATGEVKSLVEASAQWIEHSKGIGALLMLLVGLLEGVRYPNFLNVR